MVKRSKKSKSKRMPLRKKYKILRKVKSHFRKKAKEAKKLGGKKKAKVEKDPGIPNAWPFKEQELQALEARRARALEEMEQKKQAKKERAKKRKLGLPQIDEKQQAGLDDTAQQALKQDLDFEKKDGHFNNASIKFPAKDGSHRAFFKELMKVIEASDVILEVLDARDPLGSRCLDIEKLICNSTSPKNLVLIVNKIDLVPREVAEKWLKYLREELPTVAFRCSTQQQKSHLGHKASSRRTVVTSMQSSECLGAETLLQLLKNYSRNQKLKTSITVGIVGLPNVGKSSLINSLKRAKVANVGATPGVTRVLQEIQLEKHVKLLDCPGVVIGKASDNEAATVLRNCQKIEKLEDPISPVAEIVKHCPHEKLMSIYKIPSFSSLDEFLLHIANARGKLKKGGVVDLPAAARIVLRDWNKGKIPYYTMPPARQQNEQLESAIVSEWSREFNVDEVYKEEQSALIVGLPSLIESTHLELPTNMPVTMDVHDFEANEWEESNEQEQMEAFKEQKFDVPFVDEMDTGEKVVTRDHSFPNQNEKLYDAHGILNPHLARAKRRQKKKALKTSKDRKVSENDDYDFEIDYECYSQIIGSHNLHGEFDIDIEPMTGIQ